MSRGPHVADGPHQESARGTQLALLTGIIAHEIKTLFPVHVFRGRLGLPKDTIDTMAAFLHDARAQEQLASHVAISTDAGSTFWTNSKLHALPEFEVLSASAMEKVRKLVHDTAPDVLEYLAPKMTEMWGNVYPPGARALPHMHTNVALSGVYYLKAAPNAGATLLYDPLEYAKMAFYDNFLKQEELAAEEDVLVIFPSFLRHASQPNDSDDDRVIVSFNVCME